jgi:hypothetical protein
MVVEVDEVDPSLCRCGLIRVEDRDPWELGKVGRCPTDPGDVARRDELLEKISCGAKRLLRSLARRLVLVVVELSRSLQSKRQVSSGGGVNSS